MDAEIYQTDLLLSQEKHQFRTLYDRLDRSSSAFDRLIRFRKRLEKDVEYFVRDLQRQQGVTDQEKQLRVMRKKIDNYRRLRERIHEDHMLERSPRRERARSFRHEEEEGYRRYEHKNSPMKK